MINFEYDLDKSFQKVLYRINNWINKRSGWIIESVDTEYVKISVYCPLSGSTYIKLSCELKISMKDLIYIKNNDNKFFLWCYIRYLNSIKMHPKRITNADKKMVNDLDYEGIEFPVPKKDFSKTEKKNNIYINVFCYENKLTDPVYVQIKSLKIVWIFYWLVMKISHFMSTSKILTDLCAIKQSIKIKNTFVDISYNVLVVKEFWQSIKKFV